MASSSSPGMPGIALSGSFFPDESRHTPSSGGIRIQDIGTIISAERWNEVKDAVRSDPEIASLRNWAKKTPLHMCCERGAPPDAVRALLEADPSAASVQDIFGYTPLHLAFVSNSDRCRAACAELVKADPDALLAGDKQGYVPLHRAVSANMPVEILLDLIEARPEALSAASDRGGVPLDAASLPVVERLLEAAPRCARLEIGSVLHWACRPRPSASVDVGSLVGRRPEDVRRVDARGRIPLHVGCLFRKYFPDTYLTALLRAYPEGATVPDDEGNIPLHYACRAGYTDRGEIKSEAEAEVFRELIRTSGREALAFRNFVGRTPLHVACRSRALWPETFRLLLEACPDSIRCEDARGSTPVGSFMEGCSEQSANNFMAHGLFMDEKVWQMLNVLLRSNFEVEADRPLEDGSNTLHSCLRVRRCPRDFLWLVASQYPDQITSRDTRGRFPLHAAAAHLDRSGEAASFMLDLMCHHPAALKVRDDDKKYPLAHMIDAGRLWRGGVREAIICNPQALYDCSMDDALLPRAISRICSAKKLEPVFELIRGKPHKFFSCVANLVDK